MPLRHVRVRALVLGLGLGLGGLLGLWPAEARASPAPPKTAPRLQLKVDERLWANLGQAATRESAPRLLPAAAGLELEAAELSALPPSHETRRTPLPLLIGAAGVQAAALLAGAFIPIPGPERLTAGMGNQLARAGALAAFAAATPYTGELIGRALERAGGADARSRINLTPVSSPQRYPER